jgi:hypothetical protein
MELSLLLIIWYGLYNSQQYLLIPLSTIHWWCYQWSRNWIILYLPTYHHQSHYYYQCPQYSTIPYKRVSCYSCCPKRSTTTSEYNRFLLIITQYAPAIIISKSYCTGRIITWYCIQWQWITITPSTKNLSYDPYSLRRQRSITPSLVWSAS